MFWALFLLSTSRPCYGQPRLTCWCWSPFVKTVDNYKYIYIWVTSCRNRGFPSSTNFESRVWNSALVWVQTMDPKIFVNLAVNKIPTRCGRGVNNIKLYVQEARVFSTSDSKGDCGQGGGSRCLDALAHTTHSSTFHALFFLEIFSPVFRPILVPPPIWVKMSRREVQSPLISLMFSVSRGSQNH